MALRQTLSAAPALASRRHAFPGEDEAYTKARKSLLAEEIAARLPAGVTLFDSAEAVARQTLRRIDGLGDAGEGSGTVEVFVSGRPGALPPSAEAFDAGRLLGAIKA